ncbi:MAG: primosomal protein N' [Lachnospiraceae bacterium]|jgi:primosomal protein N' (replication factor Y)|nr:primosomal protein N' [Lachnospiraceae bacterium]
MKYAKIIINITAKELDKSFDYIIPSNLEDKVVIGSQVIIPFGKGNRDKSGYVVDIVNSSKFSDDNLKEIKEIKEKSRSITNNLIDLAVWIHLTYGGSLIAALKTVIPVKEKQNLNKEAFILLNENEEFVDKYYNNIIDDKRKEKQVQLIDLLRDLPKNDWISSKNIEEDYGISLSVLKTLEKHHVIYIEKQIKYRRITDENSLYLEDKTIELNSDQKKALEIFEENVSSGLHKPFLLNGVTGSGKTEVYMEMIKYMQSKGKKTILLIPEISLTFQTVSRFQRVFHDRVAILNSRLSKGEKSDQIELIENGLVDLVIGPRSALFAPINNLGLIIIDEEHEKSFNSEITPKYHSIDVAIKRGEIENAFVVLGSGTPLVESYYKAKINEYTLLSMPNRINNTLPNIHLIDMKDELKAGNSSILSEKLVELIKDRLLKKEQVMLFINRRGYFGFVSCRSCGYVEKCPHCDIALTYHNNGKYVCHYCGYEKDAVSLCPECGSKSFGGFKIGTEQIEKYLQKVFPEASIGRMDADTTRKKHGHAKILGDFANKKIDILIGTQMIIKGHDYENVTLVAALAADLSLFENDFRSSETTYDLLAQASGRAGRGSKAGDVVIQTYNPDNPVYKAIVSQKYEDFYNDEIKYRKLMNYPPFGFILTILLSSYNENLVETGSNFLFKFAKSIGKKYNVEVLGPSMPFISKIKDLHRRTVYIKGTDKNTINECVDDIKRYIDINSGFDNIYISYDFI